MSGPVHIDRRTALKALGALSAAPLLPACGTIDPSLPPDWPLLRERIDTVVVLMMENRSFDHVFGSLSLEEGRTDVDGLTAHMSNPHPSGHDVHVFPTSVDCLTDPPHGWGASRRQFAEGSNSGFVGAYEPRNPSGAEEVMGYLTRDRQPVSYALADGGTLCDRWFCSQMSSTWPNRFYSHCAQNGGKTGNRLPDESFPSLYTLLDAAGLTWGGYFGNLPFLSLVPDKGPASEGRLQLLEHFFDDAANGDLPNVTIVEPMYGRNDDHPPAHPLAGQVFIAQIYEALARSPQWERMAIIITYDEHGGFFDHVPPPTAPDERAAEGFDQLGFRVPALVVGPWAKPGHVSSEVCDHTSILAFAEHLFELDALTERDAAANPLRSMFDPVALSRGRPLAPVELPPVLASDDELYASECVTTLRGEPLPVTGQPELEAWADQYLSGSPLDRRVDTDILYEDLLNRAEAAGLLVRL